MIQTKMSKGRYAGFLVALFLTNVAVLADAVIVPTASELYTVFDDVTLVNFILTGPALLMVFSTLLCGKLMEHISKKKILVAAFAIFAVAAIFGAAVENVYYVLSMRCIVGFAYGIVSAAAMALIADVYADDEDQRSKVLGFYNASMAGCGAIMSFVAGFLAAQSWTAVFRIYWNAVPILVLMVLFLPETHAEAETSGSSSGQAMQAAGNRAYLLHWLASVGAFFAITILYNFMYFEIAVYVVQTGIGDTVLAGTYSSLLTIGSACACVAFGFVYAKMKRFTALPSYILFTVAMCLYFLMPSVAASGAASLFLGMAFGNAFSYYFMRSSIIVPPEKVGLSISVTYSVQGLAVFLSSFVVTWIIAIMGTDTVISTLPVWIIVSAVGGVLCCLLAIRDNKHPFTYAAPEPDAASGNAVPVGEE